MILRLLFMLILALLCAVLTKGQPSGSIQQLEETKKQLHLTFEPIELVNKTHEQRWPLLGGYFMDFEAYKKDSVVAYSILQELDSIAVAHYDEDLQREVDHMSRHFRTYSTGLTNKEKTQQAISNWQTYATAGKDWEKFLTTFQVVYRCCMQNVEPEICFKAIAYGKRMYESGYRHPLMAYFMVLAAMQYHRYEDLINAKSNTFLALSILEHGKSSLSEYNNFSSLVRLGLIHQEMGKTDSSDHYFNKALYFLEQSALNRELFGPDVYRFLGKNEYLRGNYDVALQYLQANTDSLPNKRQQTWIDANNGTAYTIMADIFLRKGNMRLARTMLNRAERLIRGSAQFERFELLYNTKASYAAHVGANDLFISYQDSAKMVADSVARLKHRLRVVPAEINAQLQDAALKAADAHQQLKWYQRTNWIVCLLATILAGAGGIYYNGYRKREHALLQTLSTEKKSATKLVSEIAHIKQKVEHNQPMATGRLVTEEAWCVFMEKMTLLHSGFLETFKTRHGALTKGEKRLCYLTYLNHTDTQIADITGVNENSVRVNRSRVKKKMGLDKTDELQDYLRSLM